MGRRLWLRITGVGLGRRNRCCSVVRIGHEFSLLGPLEVRSSGLALDLGGQKQRALLALLLLEANRVVSSDRLIDALWEEEPTPTAGKALQGYVSQLRKLLGADRVATKAPGYLLRVSPGELDLAHFEKLRSDGMLDEALSLWRGPPLAEFASQRFAQAEIARLEELHLVCVEERIERDLTQGRHAELVAELEVLVEQHPLREPLRSQLMLALYRSGRQAEALDEYQDARAALVEQLGIEPTRALRDLQQAILRQDPALDLVPAGEPTTATARGALVGRERELAELVDGLDDAFAGRGRLFLLVGEPGIGKSRLADELATRARARGARVVFGRCWEAGGAPAYWPWVQSLRAYIRETEPDALREQLGSSAADLGQLLPELRELFPDLPEPPVLEPESARFRLFEVAASFLSRAARARPLVLVLDDLHAADEPSLLLLQFLVRQLGDSRLLVVAAYRDVDPGPTDQLAGALTELVREPVTRRLALTGLTEDDVARFIELASGEASSRRLAARVHGETDGNPLFVGEIVRLLAEEGKLDAESVPQLAIPQSVREVISRRLRHLSPGCNGVLLLASVLGREFALDTVVRAGEVSEAQLLDMLDEAILARVVSEVPGATARLRFAHVLIRDTLYDGLTTPQRIRLHRQVVEALEQQAAAEPERLAELAYHAIGGREFEKSTRYAAQAADRALALLGYEEAARLYRIALDALTHSQPEDEHTRCKLLLSLGDADARAGNTVVAKESFFDAAAIARRRGFARDLARAAAGYAGQMVWARAGDDELLLSLLEEGLAALTDDDDAELRVRLLARLSGVLRDEPSRDRRDALSREAVELARLVAGPASLAYALVGRAHAIIAPDTLDECLALGNELLDLAARSGDREALMSAHMLRTLALCTAGAVPQAAVELADVRPVADELRQPLQVWWVCAAQAMLALASGQLTEAELLIAEALEVGERALRGAAIAQYWLQRYTLCDFRSALEEIEPEIGRVVARYPTRPVFQCVFAHVQARLGRQAEAKRALDELARDDFSRVPFDQEWLYAMSLLAETAVLVGDTDSAAVLHRLLVPWRTLNAVDVSEGFRGAVTRYLGMLDTMLGRLDDAQLHFEAALAMNERMGARPWVAHTQMDYAQMLVARDRPGDHELARQMLGAARATYRELGMEHYGPAGSLTRPRITL